MVVSSSSREEYFFATTAASERGAHTARAKRRQNHPTWYKINVCVGTIVIRPDRFSSSQRDPPSPLFYSGCRLVTCSFRNQLVCSVSTMKGQSSLSTGSGPQKQTRPPQTQKVPDAAPNHFLRPPSPPQIAVCFFISLLLISQAETRRNSVRIGGRERNERARPGFAQCN